MEPEKSYIDDYIDFLNALNKHGVEYLIVGAYATLHYTHISRSTNDIDIWIRATEENAIKTVNALKEFMGVTIDKKKLLEDGKIFFLGKAPYRIDIFNSQGNVDFENAWSNRINGTFGNTKVHYLSKKYLLALKRHFGREQDLQDIKALNKKMKD